MWEFQGRLISSELYGDNNQLLCKRIDNDNDMRSKVDGVDNPSLHDVDNRIEDIRVFFLT